MENQIQKTPETDKAEYKQLASSAIVEANSLVVETQEQSQRAADVLRAIVQTKKNMEEKRKEYTAPLVASQKAINADFKIMKEPFEEAEKVVKGKIAVYADAQEKLRKAAEEKAAESARIAAKAEADKRAAEEAAERERLRAEEAERKLNEGFLFKDGTVNGNGYWIATREEEGALVGQARTKEAARERLLLLEKQKREEIEKKENEAAEKRAEQEAEAAAEAAAAATKEAAEKAKPAMRGSSGTASASKVWTFEILEEKDVPREYCQIHEPSIRAAIKDGIREIKGVKIFQETRISSR